MTRKRRDIRQIGKREELLIERRIERLMEPLEDRVLFDAVPDGSLELLDGIPNDPFAPAASSQVDSFSPAEDPSGSVADQESPPEQSSSEVVFVDKGVRDYQDLLADLAADGNAEVFFLDRNTDGVQRIAEVLSGRTDLDAVHIISHGSRASLTLGTATLDAESIDGQYADTLDAIGGALGEEADLLIYGCNFGEGTDGQAAVEALASRTGADVAASTDPTGHVELGGDWDLELAVGSIETSSAVGPETAAAWNHLLAPPVAVDDAYSGDEEVNIAGNVLDNDSDPDGDSITVTLIDGDPHVAWDSPSHYLASGALVSMHPDGTFTYSANNAFQLGAGDTAVDSFQYTLSDGNGGTDIATVTVTVTGLEDPPVAQDDFSVSVANGSFDGTPQTAAVPLGWQSTSGSPDVVDEDGPYNNGVDWTLSPDGGTFVRAIGSDSSFNEEFGQQVNGLIPGETYTLEFYQTNLGFYWAGGGDNRIEPGHFDFELDGVLVGQSPTAAWAPGEVPSTHTNTWSEKLSISFTATATSQFLNIAPKNEGSVAYLGIDGVELIGDGLIATDEDTPVVVDVLTNDQDPDGDPLTIIEVNGDPVVVGTPVTLPSGALVTLNSDDTFTYDPNGQYDPVAVGDTALDSFTYTITDGNGNTDTANVNVGINGLNDPVTATDNTADATENQVVPSSGNVITDDDGFGVDSDVDGDAMSVVFVDGVPISGPTDVVGTYGTLTMNEDGSYDYFVDTANPAVVALLDAGSLNETFTYTLSDGNGSTDTADLVVTVTSMDDPPINIVPDEQATTVDTPIVFSTAEGNPISTGDVDAGGADIEATVSVLNGTLTLSGTTGLSFTTGTGTDDPTMTFTGTVDEINAALEGLTYTPTPSYSGPDTLTLTVDDLGNTGSGGPLVDSDTVSIKVDAPPAVIAPIADQSGVDGETITQIDVSGNFDPVDGDTLTFSATGLPPGLVIDPDTGVISGTIDPSASTTSPYSVVVTADDGNGGTVDNTFTYAVTNPPPVGVDDAFATTEDVNAVGNLLTNDSDPDGDPLAVIEIDGVPLADLPGASYYLPSGALVTILPNGNLTYSANDAFQLGAGETAVDTFTYTLSDGNGGTDTATATITVTGVEQPPVAVDDFEVAVPNGSLDGTSQMAAVPLGWQAIQGSPDIADETGPYNFGLPWTLSPDGGTFVRVAAISDGNSMNEIFGTQIDGLIPGNNYTLEFYQTNVGFGASTTPGHFDVEFDGVSIGQSPTAEWPPGETGATLTNTWSDLVSLSFTATASSQFLQFNPVTEGASATFLGIDGIRIVGAGMVVTDEDTPIPDLDVLPNDYDPDGDPLTIIEVNGAAVSVGVPVALPSGALVTLNADSTFRYDPNGQFDSLDVGDTAPDSFTYTITDGNGGTDTATANVGILGLNDSPVVAAIPDQAGFDGESIASLDISANFSDPEGDSLTFSATNLPPGLTINPATGIISGTLDSSASTGGPYVVDITADDGKGGIATDTFTYTVTNPAPNAFDDTNITSEDTPVVGTVAANDSDSDGDTLTYTLDTGPTNGSVELNLDGSYTYTPDPGFNGVDTFTYLADDGEGGTDLATVTITLSSPPIAVDDTLSMMEDANGIGDVLINDSDPDGDPLTVIEIDGIPVSGTDSPSYYLASGALVSIRPDGSYSYSTNDAFQLGAGETAVDSFDYVISDGNGNTSTATATITITGVEQPPVAVDDLSVTVLNGSLTGLVQSAAVPVGWQAIKGSPDMVAETGPYNNGVDWALSPDGGTFVRTVGMPDDNIFNEEFGTQLNNLIPGNTYTLEFYQTNLGFGYLTAPGHYNIELDGVEVAQSPSATWPPDTYNKTSENTWTPVSVSFTATETSHLLNIAAATDVASNAYLGIDGIKITGEGAFVTDEETLIPVLDVLDNDFDPDGDPLTITKVNGVPVSAGVSATLPSGATVTLNADNTFSYDPNGQYEPLKVGESALETFNYTITDGNGGTDTANVNIVILGLNDPVTAVDDVQYTLPGMPVNIDVLGNDIDPDNDPLTVTGIIDPIATGVVIPISVGVPITLDSGTIVELKPDGTLDVTQPLGADGTETFEYNVSDGNGSTDTATVTLIVDTDGDGIANVDDIDDDNDGILDINEGSLILINSNGSFESPDTGVFTTFPAYPTMTGAWTATHEDGELFQQTGTTPAYEGEQYASLLQNAGTHTGEFWDESNWVNGSYDRIATTVAANPNTTYQVSFAHAGDDRFGYLPDTTLLQIQSLSSDFELDYQFATPGVFDWQTDTVTFTTTDDVTDLVVSFSSMGAAHSSVVVDLVQVFEVDQSLDSDTDGIADHLDIDKDNDGISDNVEAQSTAGYVAPSGMPGAGFVDLDGDGLDDRYDADTADSSEAASIGLTEIDTDSDGTVDSLDSDSDNDTVNDIAERGDGQPTSITSTADTDLDGLLDIFEGANVNDGFDVNDENLDATDTNFLLADSDNDTAANGSDAAPLLRDLDYRDNNAAPITVSEFLTTAENTPISGNVLVNDTDPDGDPITVTEVLVDINGDGTPDTLVLGTPTAITDNGGNPIGTVTMNADGTGSFDPAPGFTGPMPQIGYAVTDIQGQSTLATLDITVVPNALGIAQQQIDATKNPDGTWDATFEMVVENTGDQPLSGFDLYNDIQAAWGNKLVSLETPTLDTSGMADPSAAPTLNAAWSDDTTQNMLGDNGTLAPGDTLVVTYTATIHPDAGNASTYLWTQAEVRADLPDETEVSDLSDDGPTVDAAALLGASLDDPTPVVLPDLAVAKTHAAPVANGAMVDVNFNFYVENTGTVDLAGVSLEENLQEHFGTAFVGLAGAPSISGSVPLADRPTINPAWDGVTETNMLLGTDGLIEPGEYVLVQVLVTLDPAQATEVIYNQAIATATYDPTPGTPGDEVLVSDLSDSGTNPNGTNPTFYGDTGGTDDPTPVAFEPAVFFNNVTVREYQTATFNVRLDRASTEDIELELFTTDGTATGGFDFRDTQFRWYNYVDKVWQPAIDGNKVTMFAGQELIRVQVAGYGDNLIEPDETFTISANVTSGTVQEVVPGTGTLTDWNPAASIMIGDAIAPEGDDLVFDLELTAPSTFDEVFELTPVDNTATGGVDYETLDFEYSTDGGATWMPVGADNRVTFTPGSIRMKVRVNTTEDALDEIDETFTLSGTMIGGHYTLQTEGAGTIVDDDAAPSLRIADTMAEEGAPLVFDLELSGPATEPIVLDLTAVPHDTLEAADAGVDFESTGFEFSTDGGATWLAAVGGSQVTIPTGSSGIQVRVESIDDALDELNEHFTLAATVASGQVNGITSGVGKILDNEFPPTLSVTDVTVLEGTDPYARFSVDLSHLTSQDVLLNLSLVNQTATGAGTDFGSLAADNLQVSYDGGTTWVDATAATISAGETGFLVRTPVVDDAETEADETFRLRAVMDSNVFVNGIPIANSLATGQGTIVDDENDPTLSISDITVIEGIDTHAVFSLDLSRPAAGDLTLDLALTDNTALGGGSDYGSPTADNLQISTDGGTTWIDATSVTIPAGQTSVLVRTPVADDDLHESDETFSLTAAVTAGASQTPSAVAVATVLDDDYAAVGVAKQQTSAVRNADGSWDVTFAVVVKNSGSVPLAGIELSDDIETQLGEAYLGVSDLAVDASGMADPTQAPSINAAWTGDTSLGMLAADGTLAAGDILTISYTLTLDPDAVDQESDYEQNQAEVRADAPGGVLLVDQSDNGADPSGYNADAEPGQLSYFPFFDPNHSKMLVVENGTSGVGAGEVTVPIDVAGFERNLVLGIFDGDSGDTWDTSEKELTYTIHADPNGDGTAMTEVATLFGNDLSNNAWDEYTHTNFDEALGPDGNYHYRLVAKFTDPATVNGHSAFQLRVNGGFAVETGNVAFQATPGGISGYGAIFPNFYLEGYPFNEDPGIVTTYDGTWDFNFYVPEGTTTVDIWDADFDFGSYDGSVSDTDDPNTPGGTFLPSFNLATSEMGPEGEANANPLDDSVSPIFRRSPSVQYELIAPDGTRYLNDNPSGNQEWELFTVSTDPFDPTAMDYHADTIPSGVWQIHVVGLDLGNMAGFYLDFPMVGSDEAGNPVVPLSLEPVSEDDPTPIIVQDISATLEHAAVVTNGSNVDVTVRMVVENIGTVDLSQIALEEDLAAHFGEAYVGVAGAPRIVGGTATILPTANATWDGSTDTNVLSGTDGLLTPGQTVVVEWIATVDPYAVPGTLWNQASTSGVYDPTPDVAGDELLASDLSDSGTNPNTTNPGEPGDTGTMQDPTPLVFPQLPPEALPDTNSITEDTPPNPVTGNVLANDSDLNPDTLTVASIGGVAVPPGGSVTLDGTYGSLLVYDDGSYEYTLDNANSAVDSLSGGELLTESFAYIAGDNAGGTASSDLVITIHGKNDPPVAVDDTSVTPEDTPVLGSVAGNDSDPEGDLLLFSVDTPPSNGVLEFHADGSYTYTPDPNFNGIDTFTYLADDGEGGTTTATATITVTPTNDPPVAVDDVNATDEDTPVAGNLLTNDSDPDSDSLLTIAVDGQPSEMGQPLTLSSGAMLTLNSNNSYTYDPCGAFDNLTPGSSDVDHFTYTICDQVSGSSTAMVSVTIMGTNDPPVGADDYAHTWSDKSITVPVVENDTDADGDPLAVVILQQPESGEAVVNPDGSITYTPDITFQGTVVIRYLVEDGNGGSDWADLTIDVYSGYRFDTFNDFQEPRATGSSHTGNHREPLSREIYTLCPQPIFSGYARPGTTVVGRMYDADGTLIHNTTATTDPGGNWMMQFHGAKAYRSYRVEFEEETQSVDIYGYLGLDPADNSYRAMNSLTEYNEPLSVHGVMRNTAANTLDRFHRELTSPLGMGNAN